MTYQVLARKWRPGNFSDLVGQAHVLKPLTHALDNQRLHHAYLFTGTRGVGKTTLARILARCLNCEEGISSTPCGSCTACTEIVEGRFIDLIEVDAASRTKVEDTRELLENVQYAPTRGRYKIYLIDEVHMLSNHSFNALLKTLEEPPPHVMFLLATTDPQKLPVTILSRCLQFNLKNLTPQQIEEYLEHVLGSEKVGFEEAALWQLAGAAAGSMRDALTLLDQAISFCEGQVTETGVSDMLGAPEQGAVWRLLNSLEKRDVAALLTTIEEIAERAPDFQQLLEALLAALHRLAIAQTLPDAIDNSFGDRDQVLEFAARFSPEDLQLFYQFGVKGRADMNLAPDARSMFEMLLIRMLVFSPEGVPTMPGKPGKVDTPDDGAAGQSGGEPQDAGEEGALGESARASAPEAGSKAQTRADSKAGSKESAAGGASDKGLESSESTKGVESRETAESAESLKKKQRAAKGQTAKSKDNKADTSGQAATAAAVKSGAAKKSGSSGKSASTDESDKTTGTSGAELDSGAKAVGAARATAKSGKPGGAQKKKTLKPPPEQASTEADAGAGDSKQQGDRTDERSDDGSAYNEAATAAATEAAGEVAGTGSATTSQEQAAASPGTGTAVAEGGADTEPSPADNQRGPDVEPTAPGSIDDTASASGAGATDSVSRRGKQARDAGNGRDNSRDNSKGNGTGNSSGAVALPQTPEQLDNNNWISLCRQVHPGGITGNILAHCVLSSVTADAVNLCLDSTQAAVYGEDHRVRIEQLLTGFFDRPLQVAIEIGEPACETPAAYGQRRKREQLEQLRNRFEQDDNVQKLVETFSAEVLKETIAPVRHQ